MPLCIAGMHRSGTSMIARMLNICGLYLGTEEELYPAQPDNPEGFWEHVQFQSINNRLLEAMEGAWDKVPDVPAGWEQSSRFDALRAEAKRLVTSFATHEPWGWKDPRSSLTLAFWKSVIPDLQVLIPVRNPIDVAASLTRRGYASQLFGVELWKGYEEALERDLDDASAIYTHYTSYFGNAREELVRLAGLCGLSPTEKQLDEACATVSGGLRHSHSTLMDMLGSEAAAEVIQSYVHACARCGPVYGRASLPEWAALQTLTDNAELQRTHERDVAKVKRDLQIKLGAEERQSAGFKVAYLRSEAKLVDAQTEIGHLKWELGDVRNYLGMVERELRAIHASTSWAIARRLGRLAPEGSFLLRGLRRVRRSLGTGAPSTATPTEPEAVPKRKPQGKPDPLQVLGIDSSPMSLAALNDALKMGPKHPTFALAISHDSIQVFTGGIQTVIHDERTRLDQDGMSQLHVCPVNMVQRLSEDSTDLPLLVSVDGKAIGVANTRDLIQAVSPSRCQSVQVHHTINWNLDLLGRLLDALPQAPKFFWLHDYYTVCESYNLLRNDRAFCYAPPLESNSCEICKHGPGRAAHLPAYKEFLGRWPFTFLVPSKIAASIWLKAYPEYDDRLRVAPIYSLESTGAANPRTPTTDRKIRIAFPGISWEYKGWSHWRKLVDVLWHNPNYELLHLGQITEEFQHMYPPERFREIKSSAQNTQALADALLEEQVDIVFYCPIWYETFSLIAHEAHATGCWTLTIEESGNVAVYVRDSGSGVVFDNSDLLITYLLDAPRVREDLDRFLEQTPTLSRLNYNSSIVDGLYVGPAVASQAK